MSDAQWEHQTQQLRNLVDGLTLAEVEILAILVDQRKRAMYAEPVRVIDTRGLTGRVLEEMLRLNEIGLHRYRQGYAEYDAYAAIATPADKAMHDNPFRHVLNAIVAGANQPPTTGA